ncbi:hypothetical protein K7X08_024422 [Anisodus acutangulus]|uniref:Uncharacterized protein n=1 Tax=Anisodus acutangulus TaxID=402998 RepID=A0A9Q1M7U8_9SOLA|nr:hypothetical protein K7X08_024422 [Anisodus acutangulus]
MLKKGVKMTDSRCKQIGHNMTLCEKRNGIGAGPSNPRPSTSRQRNSTQSSQLIHPSSVIDMICTKRYSKWYSNIIYFQSSICNYTIKLNLWPTTDLVFTLILKLEPKCLILVQQVRGFYMTEQS